MSQHFDAGRLLSALPYCPISARGNLLDGYEPPVWRYPALGAYNGFSGQQRVKTWQLGTWLRRRGLLTVAPACELCGRSSRLGLHSENYADVERSVTICSGCHLALHRRFRQPSLWGETLGRCPRAPEWALALSPIQFDLSQWLASVGAPTDPFEGLSRQFPLDKTIVRAAWTNRFGHGSSQSDLFHPHTTPSA